MKMLEESVFLSEIVLQIQIAQRAAKRLPSSPAGFDNIEVWCSIQSILGAAANVSKILWPHTKKKKEESIEEQEKREAIKARGVHLRKLLNVDNQNILHSRTFRNHFEHYDERISIWFKNQKSAVYKDQVINPLETHFGPKPPWGDNPPNQHRAYDPVTHVVTFRGESIDLKAVMKALEEILSITKSNNLVLIPK